MKLDKVHYTAPKAVVFYKKKTENLDYHWNHFFVYALIQVSNESAVKDQIAGEMGTSSSIVDGYEWRVFRVEEFNAPRSA